MHCLHYAPPDTRQDTDTRSFLSVLRRSYVTHVVWDPSGSELLANYGSDQVRAHGGYGRDG
jgi:hypothetical protein